MQSVKETIRVDNLSLNIGQLSILNDINLGFNQGQFTGLLGPNGAGKSSLLKCLSRDVKFNGELSLYGKNIDSWSRNKLARQFAVLPQHASLSFPFKVHEVVAIGLYPLSLNQRQGQKLVEQNLALLDLLSLKNREYPGLSGGEKQRVQLARVLVQLSQPKEPPLLLLDEPTSALDLAQQHRVLGLMKQLVTEKHYCVISVLHDLNQAVRYADRLIVINKGQVVADDNSNSCLTANLIENVWQYRPQELSMGAKQAYL